MISPFLFFCFGFIKSCRSTKTDAGKGRSEYPYQCIAEAVDVQQVANLEKKVPLDWITSDGMQVTAAFEEYARPLILDEVTPVYVNGTPRHICL